MMIVLSIAIVVCGLQAIWSIRLLNATLWLMAVSALVATLLYALGAWQLAVIELSVGAGLVTVLMVFAITMVGDEQWTAKSGSVVLSGVIILCFLMLIILTLPPQTNASPTNTSVLSTILWKDRGLDIIAQIALMFAGVLGVLGILSLKRAKSKHVLGKHKPTVPPTTKSFRL